MSASWLTLVISILKWGTTLAAGTLAAVGAGLYIFQTSLIYPASMPAGSRTIVDTPEKYGMAEYQEHYLTTKDGEKLHCYTILQTSEIARERPTVLLFHANAGNMGHRLPIARVFHQSMKCNIFMLSYRGYGKSTGSPSEKGMKIDSQAALNFVLDDPVMKNTRLFAYGQSIGGAVAIAIVHRNQARFSGLIVENTFTSMRSLIPSVLPIAGPIAAFCHQIWSSEGLIDTLDIPVLFLSGLKDELVPPQHMRALYDRCGSKRKVWKEYLSGTHNDTVVQPGYFVDIATFIKETVTSSSDL